MKSKIDNGGPAFPHGPMGSSFTSETGITTHQFDAHPGMSLREYFAAQALNGFCSNPEIFRRNQLNTDSILHVKLDDLYNMAYRIADEMIQKSLIDVD